MRAKVVAECSLALVVETQGEKVTREKAHGDLLDTRDA